MGTSAESLLMSGVMTTWPPRLRGTPVMHAVMTVITSSSMQSNGSAVLCFLQRTAWPVETAVVRLSEPNAWFSILFDGKSVLAPLRTWLMK
jgi:hypothetical protein